MLSSNLGIIGYDEKSVHLFVYLFIRLLCLKSQASLEQQV
jgi:hypothetical protein